MTSPSDQPPSGAPSGTVWYGGLIPWFAIRLSILGDDVDPADIARKLGVEPDVAAMKGERPSNLGRKSRFKARQGMWTICICRDNPSCSCQRNSNEPDVEVAMGLLLDRVTVAPEKWLEAVGKAEARIYVSFELDTHNRGFHLPSELLQRLSDLRINADFDIYANAIPASKTD
jgi:Domain of unknown function (DUF4279)